MLRWLGHAEVAVLDGGYQAWQRGRRRARPSAAERAAGATALPRSRRRSSPAIDAASVAAGASAAALLLDARSAERFRGEVEPLDPVAGHIPGALNRFYKANLAAGGRFKPAADAARGVRRRCSAAAQPGEVIHPCGSGVTACHNLLAMEHAGLPGSLLYPGSWSEWSADPARPIARG